MQALTWKIMVCEVPLTFAEHHIDILGEISGERLQDHWSSGFLYFLKTKISVLVRTFSH